MAVSGWTLVVNMCKGFAIMQWVAKASGLISGCAERRQVKQVTIHNRNFMWQMQECSYASGVHRSHLGPVFWTSDAEVVRTAGLDSLVRSRHVQCCSYIMHPFARLPAYNE